MPRLQRFGSSEVAMYPSDHPPPHFHVLGRNGAALVEIGTLEVLRVSGRIDLRDALAWAEANQDFLRAKWLELNGEAQR